MIRPAMECAGCGAAVPIGAHGRKTNIMSISPLLYRRGAGKGRLRAGRRVGVCEACLAAFLAGTIDSRCLGIVTAMRESLARLYNATLEAEQS